MTSFPVPYTDITRIVRELCTKHGQQGTDGVWRHESQLYVFEYVSEGTLAIRKREPDAPLEQQTGAYFRFTGGEPRTFLCDHRWLAETFHRAHDHGLNPSQELYDIGMDLAVEHATPKNWLQKPSTPSS